MARKDIVPSVVSYQDALLRELDVKKRVSAEQRIPLPCTLEKTIVTSLAKHSQDFCEWLDKLIEDEEVYKTVKGVKNKAKYCAELLVRDLRKLRESADQMELLIGKNFYSIPTYAEILYSVKY